MNLPSKGLKPQKSGQALMDMYYLEARSHLLETAAILDRIDRADDGGQALESPRIQELLQAAELLSRRSGPRAEKILRLLSL